MSEHSPEQPAAEISEGDVAEDPTPPREDGSKHPVNTAQDAEDDAPLDADEGDPETDSFPAGGTAPDDAPG